MNAMVRICISRGQKTGCEQALPVKLRAPMVSRKEHNVMNRLSEGGGKLNPAISSDD